MFIYRALLPYCKRRKCSLVPVTQCKGNSPEYVDTRKLNMGLKSNNYSKNFHCAGENQEEFEPVLSVHARIALQFVFVLFVDGKSKDSNCRIYWCVFKCGSWKKKGRNLFKRV